MTFDHLTYNQRSRIVDKVNREHTAALKRGLRSDLDVIEDIVRWTVDAYMDVAGDERELAAFERGVNEALDGKYQAVG